MENVLGDAVTSKTVVYKQAFMFKCGHLGIEHDSGSGES